MKRWQLIALPVAAVAVLAVALAADWVMEQRAEHAPSTPQARVQSTWAAYRMAPGHARHVGRMKLDCAACHNVTDGGADHPGPQRCVTCHAEQAELHHGLGETDGGAGPVLSECTDCHGFGPDPNQQPGDCLRCHAEPQGELKAVTVHARDDCLGCHRPHEDAVEPQQCAECHQVSVQHGSMRDRGAERCTTCHDPHASASVASERCADCHGSQGLKPVPDSARHAEQGCAGCHSNHRFTRDSVTPCATCHGDQKVLPGAGHRTCTNCHEHHALSEPAAPRCAQCHDRIDPTHGGGDSGQGPTECVRCHDPHPARAQQSLRPCTACHDLPSEPSGAHAAGIECSRCHAPHGFVAPDKGLCRQCHVARIRQLARHDGHGQCESCHTELPHVAGHPPQQCEQCHATQAGAVRQGHDRCTSCHDPHAQKTEPPACAGCHQPQARTAGPGHARCETCHDAHSGERVQKAAKCTSCHQQRRLPGLHAQPDHRQCETCHSVHGGPPPAQRSTCLSCHGDQRDHQPEAKVCSGCHTFRGPGLRGRLR